MRNFDEVLSEFRDTFQKKELKIRFRYELYIEGKTHLVASTYLVSFSVFSFFLERDERSDSFIRGRGYQRL